MDSASAAAVAADARLGASWRGLGLVAISRVSVFSGAHALDPQSPCDGAGGGRAVPAHAQPDVCFADGGVFGRVRADAVAVDAGFNVAGADRDLPESDCP